MPTPAVRNNNPGNLKDPGTGQFAQYKTPQEGYAALLNDLETKKSGKSTTGLTPTSTLADFAKTYAPPNDSNNSGKYAADLANQLGVAPNTPISQLDTARWAAAVAHNEDKSSPFGNQKIAAAQPPQASGPETAQAATPQQQGASQVPDYASKIGNFLFPIAGDVYHDIKGDSQKTGLQQLGDAGMSALTFVPGLGEAGLAAKGAKAAVEGAQVAKGAGLLSKVAASPVARNAAVGYGAGVSQNLAQGKGLGESFGPNLNTIAGAGLGTAGGLAGKALGGLLDKATGIPENRIPVLANLSNPKLYDEYAQVGAARATNETNPSLLQHGIQYAEKAVNTIKTNLKDVGKQIGEIKTSEGATKLTDTTPMLKNFAQRLEDTFGVKVYVTSAGKVSLSKAPGRMKDVLTKGDETRLKTALSDLLTLRKSGNVRKASDVIDNLDNAISYGKKTYFGGTDPLNAFLKQTRHDLNSVVGASSPALAKAKSRAAELHDVLDEVESAGGTNFQRAGLLLKRTLSGDQGDVSRRIFDLIKKETGVDLTEHGVLIKHFVDAIGDKSEKSALQKMLEESAMKGGTTLTDLALRGGQGLLQSTAANPVKVGRNVVQGKTGFVRGLLGNNYGGLTKGLLDIGRGLSNTSGQ